MVKKYWESNKALAQKSSIKTIAHKVSPAMEEYREFTTTEIESVKQLIINQMVKVIPHTRSLDQLSRAYKTLYDCVKDIKQDNTKDKSYLQIMTMQINAMNGNLDGPKDIDYEPTE